VEQLIKVFHFSKPFIENRFGQLITLATQLTALFLLCLFYLCEERGEGVKKSMDLLYSQFRFAARLQKR